MADKAAAPTKTQIQSDTAAARTRLSANLEGLINEMHPRAMLQRGADEVRYFAKTEVDNAKSQIKDENGWRYDRLALIGGTIVGVVGVLLGIRALVNRAGR